MPRTNSRAKRAARERQQRTGEPYARARRLSATDQPIVFDGERDWQVRLGSADMLEDFIISEDGQTHGSVDHGVVLGLVNSLASSEIEHPWGEAVKNLVPLIGLHLVVQDRFTAVMRIAKEPLSYAVPARSRRLRSTTYGGHAEPLVESPESVQRQRRRNLSLRREHGVALSPDYLTYLVIEGPDGQERDYLISPEGRVSEQGRVCVGTLDYFTDAPGSDRQACTWEDFRPNPLRASGMVRGLHPIVWANESQRVEIGQVTDVVTSMAL